VRISGATRVRTAVGSGFKEPTFFENYAQGFTTGNPHLEPEHSVSFEAGFDHELGARAAIRVTAFAQRFRDMIQYTNAAAGEPNYINIGSARADGAEFEISATPVKALRISAAHTYLSTEVTNEGTGEDTQFRNGMRLLRRPAHSTSLDAAVDLGRGSVSLRANRVGERDDVDFSTFPAERRTLDAYFTVDLAASLNTIRFGDTRVQLTARIENLFDERYEEILSYTARGRALYAGLKIGR